LDRAAAVSPGSARGPGPPPTAFRRFGRFYAAGPATLANLDDLRPRLQLNPHARSRDSPRFAEGGQRARTQQGQLGISSPTPRSGSHGRRLLPRFGKFCPRRAPPIRILTTCARSRDSPRFAGAAEAGVDQVSGAPRSAQAAARPAARVRRECALKRVWVVRNGSVERLICADSPPHGRFGAFGSRGAAPREPGSDR
jgi:hypothetical protein